MINLTGKEGIKSCIFKLVNGLLVGVSVDSRGTKLHNITGRNANGMTVSEFARAHGIYAEEDSLPAISLSADEESVVFTFLVTDDDIKIVGPIVTNTSSHDIARAVLDYLREDKQTNV